MADQVSVNSVQPSEVSDEMVAYLLTASILGGAGYNKGWYRCEGLPIIGGVDKDTILTTYAECLRTVANRMTDSERSERAARRG
jgi:hypothetical protein